MRVESARSAPNELGPCDVCGQLITRENVRWHSAPPGRRPPCAPARPSGSLASASGSATGERIRHNGARLHTSSPFSHHSAQLASGEHCNGGLGGGNRRVRRGRRGAGQYASQRRGPGGGGREAALARSGVVRARGTLPEAFSDPAAPPRSLHHGSNGGTAKYRGKVVVRVCHNAAMPPDPSGVRTPRSRSIAPGLRLGQSFVRKNGHLPAFSAEHPSSAQVCGRAVDVARLFHRGTFHRPETSDAAHPISDAAAARRSP